MGKYDLTTGNILQKLLLVAIPIMGTQLIQMTYNLTDMFWLGKLSSDAVAASGTAGMFMWMSMAFMILGRMGAEIGVSQSLGRNDQEGARQYSQNALFLAVCLGVAYGAAAIFFNKQMVAFFGIKEAHVAADAAAYLRIVGFGFPAAFISGAILGTFNGAGNSGLSFAANATGMVLNMVLDPLLIFGLGLGIRGAALASVIAQITVALIFVMAVKRHKNRPFSHYSFFSIPSVKKLRGILRWSLPIGLESLLFTALSMIITRFLAPFGAEALAVSRVGSQIESLSWLIGAGFGSAMTAFTGQNFGALKWGRIRNGLKISLLFMTCWGVVVTALLFFGGHFLFSIFLQEPIIIDMGASYLKILAICQLTGCIESVSAGVFRGSGRTMPPSVTSISANMLRVPLAFALSKTALGLNGIWLGITFGAFMRGLAIFLWLLKDLKSKPQADV